MDSICNYAITDARCLKEGVLKGCINFTLEGGIPENLKFIACEGRFSLAYVAYKAEEFA